MRVGYTLLAGALLPLPAAAQGFDPPDAVDLDPAPDVVEVELVAAETTWQFKPGIDTKVWTYNGTIPGPTIRANVGDTIRVRFTNELPEPTTIHWHGLEAPADMDGAHIAQRHVQPGETFVYELPALRDAFYWYHPHVRTYDQVEKGLYGGLLIRDPVTEHELGLDRITEHLVFFDDVLLDAQNQIVPAFSFSDPVQNALYHVNGREGNLLLLNGRDASTASLAVRNGRPQRWRVVNTANTTFCRLDINDGVDGLPAKLYEIGSDGGFLERPMLRPPVKWFFESTWTSLDHQTGPQIDLMDQGILLFPAERMDVIFTPTGVDGESFTIYQRDWWRGRHSASIGPGGAIVLLDDPGDGLNPKQPYLRLDVVGPDPGEDEYTPPRLLRPLPPTPQNPVGALPVVFGHGNPDPDTGEVVHFVQAMMTMVPGQGMVMTPLPTPLIDSFNAHDVDVGEVWDWKVTNLTHGDHPFHAHGFFFELLEYEWQNDLDPDPSQNFKWQPTTRRLKDTIRIPARLGLKGPSRTITTLRVRFDDTGREGRVEAQGMLPTFDPSGAWTSGGWLFHCHILEHSGSGMLSILEVHEPDEVFRLLGKSLPGTLGKPSLTARGDLTPGSPVQLDLVNALPGARVILVTGDKAARSPFAGGELVPGVSSPQPLPMNPMGTRQTVASAEGTATWQITDWEALPSGGTYYAQVAIRDPGGSAGWALSNALSFVRP